MRSIIALKPGMLFYLYDRIVIFLSSSFSNYSSSGKKIYRITYIRDGVTNIMHMFGEREVRVVE